MANEVSTHGAFMFEAGARAAAESLGAELSVKNLGAQGGLRMEMRLDDAAAEVEAAQEIMNGLGIERAAIGGAMLSHRMIRALLDGNESARAQAIREELQRRARDTVFGLQQLLGLDPMEMLGIAWAYADIFDPGEPEVTAPGELQ